jgi:hypothetical protein
MESPLVTVDISEFVNLHDIAEHKGRLMGELRGSHQEGAANWIGILGELVFCEFVHGAEQTSSYQHDVRIGDVTLDIKTKGRHCIPEPFYDASISDWNTDQNCDYYYFMSYFVEEDLMTFCGFMSPAEYYDKCTFYAKGDIDTSNGYEFPADMHNLSYKNLYQLPQILEYA